MGLGSVRGLRGEKNELQKKKVLKEGLSTMVQGSGTRATGVWETRTFKDPMRLTAGKKVESYAG